MSIPTQPQTGADVMAQFIPSSPFVAKLGIVADVLDPMRCGYDCPGTRPT
jgi:hypothetical protein